MAYLFQVFVFKAVFTSAQANQIEINVRDHVHGTAGVVVVPDTGLSANVALKNIDNAFSDDQSVVKAAARLDIDAVTGDPSLVFRRGGVLSVFIQSTAINTLRFLDNGAGVRVAWDLSTNPGTLITGAIPDARLTANVPLLNAATNTFTGQIKVTGGVPGANKVLTSDATGLATWEVSPLAPFLEGGNVAGANRTLGNTDAFDLGFETSNITRLNITAAGDISIIGKITQDVTIQNVSPRLNLDALGGTPFIRFKLSAVNQAGVGTAGLNLLHFQDGPGATKVAWDLSGTNGKLTQGDVPWPRVQAGIGSIAGAFGTIVANSTSVFNSAGYSGLAVGDFVMAQLNSTASSGLVFHGSVISATEVDIYVTNPTTSSIVLGTATIFITVASRL